MGKSPIDEITEVMTSVGHMKEPARLVATYLGYRDRKGGEPSDVRVEVFQYLDPPNLRGQFYAQASDPEGRIGSGNPAESEQLALINLHWEALDKPPVT